MPVNAFNLRCVTRSMHHSLFSLCSRRAVQSRLLTPVTNNVNNIHRKQPTWPSSPSSIQKSGSDARSRHSSSILSNIDSNHSNAQKTSKISKTDQKHYFSHNIALDPNLVETAVETVETASDANLSQLEAISKDDDTTSHKSVTQVPNTNISITTRLKQNSNAHIPDYLESTYWWAYTHPKAVKFWERQWLVNAILWGNFNMLRDLALNEIKSVQTSKNLKIIKNNNNNNNSAPQEQNNGLRVLQMAAVYGNFSSHLSKRLLSVPNSHNTLEIVDIAPIQLKNTLDKLLNQLSDVSQMSQCDSSRLDVFLTQSDSSAMMQNNNKNVENVQNVENSDKFDVIYVFFLLHEQPWEVRAGTINECMRLLQPGGKIVFVDYHEPQTWHPLRPVMKQILTRLEPFAMDLWNHDIQHWIDEKKYQCKECTRNEQNLKDLNEMDEMEQLDVQDGKERYTLEKQTYFGGLYQKVVVEKV